jgi:hypothetical protein
MAVSRRKENGEELSSELIVVIVIVAHQLRKSIRRPACRSVFYPQRGVKYRRQRAKDSSGNCALPVT